MFANQILPLKLKQSGNLWFYQGTFERSFYKYHNFDILCLSKTFLDSTIDLNDENINIDGCSILRADHLSKNKRGGVCIYFKQSLSLISRDDLSTMHEAIVTAISVKNETCFFSHASIGHQVEVMTSLKTSVQN